MRPLLYTTLILPLRFSKQEISLFSENPAKKTVNSWNFVDIPTSRQPLQPFSLRRDSSSSPRDLYYVDLYLYLECRYIKIAVNTYYLIFLFYRTTKKQILGFPNELRPRYNIACYSTIQYHLLLCSAVHRSVKEIRDFQVPFTHMLYYENARSQEASRLAICAAVRTDGRGLVRRCIEEGFMFIVHSPALCCYAPQTRPLKETST